MANVILLGLTSLLADFSSEMVSDLSSIEIRGTALGTFETFTGLAAIPAGLIAGVLWNINQTLPFVCGLALALIAVILFTSFVKKPA